MNQLLQAPSITIIGGADGPTKIFVSPESFKYYIFPIFLLALIFCIFSIIFFIKRKKKFSKNKKKLILPTIFLIISTILWILIIMSLISFLFVTCTIIP